MVAEDWFSKRDREKEERADQEFENRLNVFVEELKSKLKDKEDEIIESIIADSQKETGKLSYDGRKKAIKSFQDNDLIKYLQEFNITGINYEAITSEYSFYIRKTILLDFPEYEMGKIISLYDQFLLQENEIRENLKEDLEKLQSPISSIELFIRLINCDKKWKKGIKNLLLLDQSIKIKEEEEILEEIAKERLKEILNTPSPKEKLIKSLGKDILKEFKESLKEEKKAGQFFSLSDLITYCIDKINKEYNLRFSEEDINILLEIGQNYLKKIKYK